MNSSPANKIFALCFCLCFGGFAFAGQLDIAVIQYQGAKEPAEISDGLTKVKLAEIVDADKTRTRVAALQGGNVLFAQSLPVAPGQKLSSSTRIRNGRADVKGKLDKGSLEVEIALIEGVRSGLRNFKKTQYKGAGALPSGRAVVLSIVQSQVSSPSVVKGRAKLDTQFHTTIVAAQYHP